MKRDLSVTHRSLYQKFIYAIDMYRTTCVYCAGDLELLYTLPNMPTTYAPTDAPPDTDSRMDMEVGTCILCGCVQLKTLVDPAHLYASPHNGTMETPTWKAHHAAFAEFVTAQGVPTLLEIGGSSGSLVRSLPADIAYTCLDMCPPTDPAIRSIVANCETYDYAGVETVCMSHVFEHLYAPREFVARIAPHVKTVLLSIPNMQHLLSIRSSSIVFFEHTYFVDKDFLVWLFAQHGYRLRDAKDYRTHSVFLAFERGDTERLPLVPRTTLAASLKDIHDDRIRRWSSLTIPPNACLMPAGHMGQLIYTLTQPSGLWGFLDNDPTKQGHRVYGTPGIVYPVETVATLKSPTVYLYGGVYTEELVAQLLTHNPSSDIHIL